MLWLVSDAAKHFNGQEMSFNGRKTALWTHPREVHEAFKPQAWTLEDLTLHYGGIQPEPLYEARFVE